MLRLTIWMNSPTFYQGDLFRALVGSGEVDLQVVFAKDLTRDRLDLGWQNDLTGYCYRFLNERNKIAHAMHLAFAQRDRFHIVNGIWTEPAFTAALVTLALTGSAYAIYSEASDPDLPRSMSRRLLQSVLGKVLAPKTAGALSISHLAVEFYTKLGVPQEAIYPFGYFRSHTQIASSLTWPKNENKIEIIFSGQIIHRKGLDLLIEAMLPLLEQHPNLLLTVIGTGEMLPVLLNQVEALGVTNHVQFEGAIPPDKIPARMAVADVLVLPSRWDGWGVVVNEAFSVGLPVIVSDSCGAADLVQNGVNGYVFRSEDVADLRGSLSKFLDRRADWPYLRARSAATGQKISIEEVTPYFIKCLKHMTDNASERPSPPWEQLGVFEGHSSIG